MTAYIGGPAILLTARDAAALDRQLRDAIRYAYLTRGLPPPRVLLELADDVNRLANQFRENAEVSAARETTPAKPASLPPSSDQLTTEQAAQVMGITPQYVRRLARRGDVTASQTAGEGAPWAIDAASAFAWAEDRRQAQHARKAA